jgi:hypothetical protein
MLETLELNELERMSNKMRYMEGGSEENHGNISQDNKSSG